MTGPTDFEQTLARATSGDAAAQYALSSALHERGRYDESLQWLRKAAAQQWIPARITLAALLMDGRHCARDRQQAIDLLQPLAATQAPANMLLSELFGFAVHGLGSRESGLRFLLAAARLGDPAALRQFAQLCILHQHWNAVRPLLDAAARRGDPAAAYALARCFAEGIGGDPNPAFALAILRSGAARDQYLAARLGKTLSDIQPAPGPVRSAPPVPALDWQLLENLVKPLTDDIRPADGEVLNGSPLIRVLPGVVHPLVLDMLINLAAPLVRRSQIIDATTGIARADPMRSSSHVTLAPQQHDHGLEAVERCIGCITGLSSVNGEFLQILRYRIGEEFKPHVDYFNEGGAAAYKSLADGGQRAQTVLVYLNDDYAGGTTRFPDLGLDIKGRPGDVLHFHNLDADGRGHRSTLHAGMPILAGEKWLLSQWIRKEPYPPRLTW